MAKPSSDHPRIYERFLADIPMRLWDASGRILDEHAAVRDMAVGGFGFETKAEVKQGDRLNFEISLEEKGSVSGAIKLLWARKDEWGCWAGGRIVRMSWGDRRKLKNSLSLHGYDWGRLLRQLFMAAFFVMMFLIMEHLIRHHVGFLELLARKMPIVLAAAAMGISVVYFVRRR